MRKTSPIFYSLFKKAQYENACQVFQNQQGLIILPTVDIDKLFTIGVSIHVCK